MRLPLLWDVTVECVFIDGVLHSLSGWLVFLQRVVRALNRCETCACYCCYCCYFKFKVAEVVGV